MLSPSLLFYLFFLLFTYYIAIFIVYLPQLNQLTAAGLLHGLHSQPQSYFSSVLRLNSRAQDLTDAQLKNFLSNSYILFPVAILFILLSQFIQYYYRKSGYLYGYRRVYYFMFSSIFLFVICGLKIIFPIILISINYIVCFILLHYNYSRLYILFSWLYNVGILLLNEYYSGYSFQLILGENYSWLDSSSYSGLMHWSSSYNLVILKIISFNSDQLWAKLNRPTVLHQHTRNCAECVSLNGVMHPCYNWREKSNLSAVEYNYLNYYIYLFYVPLYFAGPTITFNAFISYIQLPYNSLFNISYLKYLLIYFLRWVLVFFLLEIFLHYFYVYSLFHSGAYIHLTTAGQCLAVYFVLVVIWLKFVYLWRFFRLWSLLDGINPIENMNRCVSNNYSVQLFWKSWHRSFNRWLVRYIFIPLGGSKTNNIGRTILNILIVFTFVALWHDRSMNLFLWGWLIGLLFVPEILFKYAFNSQRLKFVREMKYFNDLAAAGYAINIFGMMLANFIGYSIGVGGSKNILNSLFTAENIPLLIWTFATFFSAVQIMFKIRELEQEKGIKTVEQ